MYTYSNQTCDVTTEDQDLCIKNKKSSFSPVENAYISWVKDYFHHKVTKTAFCRVFHGLEVGFGGGW